MYSFISTCPSSVEIPLTSMTFNSLNSAGSVTGMVTSMVFLAGLINKNTGGVDFQCEFAFSFVEVGDHADHGDGGIVAGESVAEDSGEKGLVAEGLDLHFVGGS